MRKLIAPLLVVFVLALGACAGAVPGNPQGFSGQTFATVEIPCKVGDEDRLCVGEIRDGKEKENVSLEVELHGVGTMKYSAAAVRAFDGQAIRGEVEKAVAQHAADVTPGFIDAVVDIVKSALLP